jgi:RNA polymerase sigma factor (sigma-70 family)
MGMRDSPAGRTDAELLADSSRDAVAFAELYRRHARSIHAWCRRRLEWAASDLTAETFARAWLSRGHFRDDRNGSALPWLLGIARNVLYESARQDRLETRARERLGLPLDLAIEDGYTAVEDRVSPRVGLNAALDLLPAHERSALKLRVVDELAYADVAAQLAIKPAAARLRVSRALRRLAVTTPKEER